MTPLRSKHWDSSSWPQSSCGIQKSICNQYTSKEHRGSAISRITCKSRGSLNPICLWNTDLFPYILYFLLGSFESLFHHLKCEATKKLFFQLCSFLPLSSFLSSFFFSFFSSICIGMSMRKFMHTCVYESVRVGHVRLGWLVTDFQFCLPSSRIRRMCHHTQLFTWVLGLKLRSSHLQELLHPTPVPFLWLSYCPPVALYVVSVS